MFHRVQLPSFMKRFSTRTFFWGLNNTNYLCCCIWCREEETAQIFICFCEIALAKKKNGEKKQNQWGNFLYYLEGCLEMYGHVLPKCAVESWIIICIISDYSKLKKNIFGSVMRHFKFSLRNAHLKRLLPASVQIWPSSLHLSRQRWRWAWTVCSPPSPRGPATAWSPDTFLPQGATDPLPRLQERKWQGSHAASAPLIIYSSVGFVLSWTSLSLSCTSKNMFVFFILFDLSFYSCL